MEKPVRKGDAHDEDCAISLSVGHVEIDRQHQEIFRQIAAIKELLGGDALSTEISASFHRLLLLFREHFAFEEVLMKRHGYAHLARHREDHQKLLEEGDRLLKEVETQSEADALKMFGWWNGWSLVHVVAEDLELGTFLRSARSASA